MKEYKTNKGAYRATSDTASQNNSNVIDLNTYRKNRLEQTNIKVQNSPMYNIRRGDIILVDLGDKVGSEQKGKRPCVILSNDKGNCYSPILNVLPLTTQNKNKWLPIHVNIDDEFLKRPSTVLCEQIQTIDKSKVIGKPMYCLNDNQMIEIENAIKIQLGLSDSDSRRNDGIA